MGKVRARRGREGSHTNQRGRVGGFFAAGTTLWGEASVLHGVNPAVDHHAESSRIHAIGLVGSQHGRRIS